MLNTLDCIYSASSSTYSVPPCIVAALPASGKESAEQLHELHLSFIDKARKHGLKILSFGTDGAATERNAQELLRTNSSASKLLSFSDDFYGISCSVPVIDDVPLIPVQDTKHAKKTCRNQVFSSARLLTFASTTVRYDQVYTLQKLGSVLLTRDVVNVDKQDDMAALRTFSSRFLSEVVSMATEDDTCRSLAAYLFVMGDLIDSYLNRKIGHKERIQMVMRGWFFLQGW